MEKYFWRNEMRYKGRYMPEKCEEFTSHPLLDLWPFDSSQIYVSSWTSFTVLVPENWVRSNTIHVIFMHLKKARVRCKVYMSRYTARDATVVADAMRRYLDPKYGNLETPT